MSKRSSSSACKKPLDVKQSQPFPIVESKDVPKRPSAAFRILAYTAGKPPKATAIMKQSHIQLERNGQVKIDGRNAKYWWVAPGSKQQSGDAQSSSGNDSGHDTKPNTSDLPDGKIKMKQFKKDLKRGKRHRRKKAHMANVMDFIRAESEWTKSSLATCDNSSESDESDYSHTRQKRKRKTSLGRRHGESHVSSDLLGSWPGKLPGVVYSKRPPITVGQRSWPWPWSGQAKQKDKTG